MACDRKLERGVILKTEIFRGLQEEITECSSVVPLDEPYFSTGMEKEHAWASGRAADHAPDARKEPYAAISAMGPDGPAEPMIIQGLIDESAFLAYLENRLLPRLSEGAILIMDNCSVHKTARVRSLLDKRRITVLDAPPYSSEFNPIENMRSKAKAIVKKIGPRDKESLVTALGQAFESISPENSMSWFVNAGYFCYSKL